MIDLTEKSGHRRCPLTQLGFERPQNRLLGNDIHYHLEREQHDQQQPNRLCRQTDADPPDPLILSG
jgi:hypothetical protein